MKKLSKKKTVLIAGGVGLAALAFWALAPKRRRSISQRGVVLNPGNPNITTAEAKQWADSFENAMRGPGTDETVVVEALENSGLEGDDLKLIFVAFGERPYPYTDSDTYLNLFEWYGQELSDGWWWSDKTKVRNIWEKSGMQITF